MLDRLRRTLIGFGVVMAAYTAYRVTAVPFLEPSVAPPTQSTGSFTQSQQSAGDPRLTRLFKPGSWQLNDPIKLENDHSILLMKDYHNLPDGRVEMFPCSIVFFPADSNASDGDQPQGRVIVLDAPAGAVAQFDQPLDLQKGKIGRLLGAQFHGPITIRGTPSRPGATDDILVTTQNVQMNTELIWTPEPVDFRFGQSTGHGRDLQMHLLPSTHAGDHGPGIGGIQTIDLLRDVQMRLVSGGGIMPMDPHHHDEKTSANSATKPAEEKPPSMSNGPIRRNDLPAPVPDLASVERHQPGSGFAGTNGAAAPGRSAALPISKKPNAEPDLPVDIRCKGKFRFDMVQYLATFEDQVEVLRTPHVGPSDEMICPKELIIHFAPREAAEKASPATAHPTGGSAAPAAPKQSGDSAQKMPNLEARRIEARGTQRDPVIVRAPSSGSYARGEHLDYDIPSQQLTLDGGDEVTAQQQENEIHAPSIVYQPGEAGRLGRLLAIGPGWLRGVPPQSADKQPKNQSGASASAGAPAGPQPPPQLFEAHWTRQLKMRPYEDNHVISLIGDARAGFTGQGELSADEIHLWLLEPPPVDKSHPAPPAAPGAKSQIQPDRMLAIGQVRINSPQLMGSCGRLEAWFQQATTPAAPRVVVNGAAPMSQPFGMPIATGGAISAPNNVVNNVPGNASNNADAPFRAVASQNGSQNGSPNSFMPAFGGPQTRGPGTAQPQRYEVDGQRIRVQLLTRSDGPTTVEDLAVDGQVHLVEIQTPQPGDQPLHVSGDSLQVVRASEPDTGVTVSGKPAQVASRGMEMYGDVIRLDKGTNRLWIDGPGRMKLPANQVASDNGGFGGLPGTAPRGAGGSSTTPPPPGPPIFVDWQGRMAFDGLLARFERSVVCQTETRNLRTELLDVTMRQRVNFAQPQSGQRTDVGRIFCHGDVLMESRGFDIQHLLTNVERLRAHDLTVDEVTGLIDGQGPGWLTSVRKGSQDLAPGAPTNGRPPAASQPIIPVTTQSGVQPAVALAAQRPAARAGAPGQPHGPTDPNRLTYLNVQFQGPITGNVNDHEITFHDQVHTIYGPVLAWEDQLNFDKVADLGPDDELMHCNQLTLRQGAIVQQPGQPDRRPMEMEAIGNVSVEGATFHALANRMTYAEAKDLLVLEGDGRADAELYRQERVGAPPTRIAARKILYWRIANQVSVNDARFFDLDQGTTATAPPSVTNNKTPDKKPLAGKKPPPATGTITP